MFRAMQLVEAKLKRAFQEGQAARAAGQDPLAAELAATTHRLHLQAAAQPFSGPLIVEVRFSDFCYVAQLQ